MKKQLPAAPSLLQYHRLLHLIANLFYQKKNRLESYVISVKNVGSNSLSGLGPKRFLLSLIRSLLIINMCVLAGHYARFCPKAIAPKWSVSAHGFSHDLDC